MALICVAGPVVEPVTVAEAKQHMRVELDEEDALIGELISASREHLETTVRPRLAMLRQTWLWVSDRWPRSPWIELRPYPLLGVTSISYTDAAGTTTVVDSSLYQVDLYSEPGRVFVPGGWPNATLAPINGLRVEFEVGYGSTADQVPRALRQAVLLLTAHWYENREIALVSGAVPKELPFAVAALTRPWRREV